MAQTDQRSRRKQIEAAIAAQEALRGTLDDALIDTTIASLQAQLQALEPVRQLRKLATILFMDIAGHTALVRDLDPEDQMTLIDPLLARMASEIDAFGGHVARFQGDGFKAVFGLPIAHENDATHAVRAGLAIQAAAGAIAAELQAERGLAGFKVRVGITTGMVYSGGETEGEDTIKGSAVNLAARLESAAEPGTVLISHDTYRHVRGIFDVEPRDPVQAKGFDRPVPVYRVLRAKPRPFRRGSRGVEGIETRMIGRDGELKILQDAYYTSSEEQVHQAVTVVGEAGLGKSRLLYEFENWVDLLPEKVWLFKSRAQQEAQNNPFALLRDLLAFRFEIQTDDSANQVREKLARGIQDGLGTDHQAEMKAHFIGQLLGYGFEQSEHIQAAQGDPQQVRDRAMRYLLEYFQALTSRQRVLLLFEDIHWADDRSLDVINQFGYQLADLPMLVVSAARPGLFDRRPHWGEGRKEHTCVQLRMLTQRASRGLVKEILQKVDDIPAPLEDLIVEHAEGNPYFVEELIKMLIELEIIRPAEGGWTIAFEELERFQVPQTLTAILQARLDGLPEGERVLLQRASVVGRIFWDELLAYLQQADSRAAGDVKLSTSLAALRTREMIFRRELSAFREAAEYLFKHDLLREVTYESVLLRLRERYHDLVAGWLIEHAGERTREFSALIAGHLEAAGQPERALPYLILAGDRAATRFANQDAVRFYSLALEQAAGDARLRFDLLAKRISIFEIIAQREEQRSDIDALLQTAKDLQDEGCLCDAHIALADYYIETEHDLSMEPAEKAVELARRSEDPLRLAHALRRLGYSSWHFDDYERSKQVLSESVALFREAGQLGEAAASLHTLSLALNALFQSEDALQAVEEAVALSRTAGDRRQEATGLRRLAIVLKNYQRYSEALPIAEAALHLHREIGDRLGEGQCLNVLAYIHAGMREFEQAESCLHQFLALGWETGSNLAIWQGVDNLITLSYAPRGEFEKGLAFVEDQRMKAGSTGDDWLAAYLLILKCLLLFKLGQYEAILRLEPVVNEYLEQRPAQMFDLIFLLSGIGLVHAYLGQYEEGRERIRAALQLAREAGIADHYPAQADLAHVALLEKDPLQLRTALAAVRRINAKMEAAERVERMDTLALLSRLHLALGEDEPALACSTESVRLLEEEPWRLGYADDNPYFAHALALQSAGRLEEAAGYLQRAHDWVMLVAEKTQDAELRRSWLEAVPENRAVLAAYRQAETESRA